MIPERIERLRKAMYESGCDAFFSVSPPDNQYLSGFQADFGEISSGILLTASDALFLTDSRYTEQAREQVQCHAVEQIKGDLLARAGECLAILGATLAAYNPAALTVDELDRLLGAWPGETVREKTLVSELRALKSDPEIGAIREASRIAEGVLADLVPTLAAGETEAEFAARMESEFRKRGASGVAFPTIVLFGERSSLPHGRPSDRPLRIGDIVLVDCGCRRAGYCSDLTRTFTFGTIPGAWFEEIYDVVFRAQRAALEAIRAGVPCSDVDAVARRIISGAGYGDQFGHGLGHGVGIEIHEGPRLNPTSDAILAEGMIVTVEPGIYLPGKGGVRIEDLVVVTRDGCEVLTESSKELRVLAA